MRLAILGTRGIPARYGGFETFAEELSTGLSKFGIEVTVFCEARDVSAPSEYKGVKLRYVSSPAIGPLETILYDARCLWIARRDFDVVYMLGYGAAPLCLLPRFSGTQVWINPDGLEWARAKWGLVARTYFHLMEWACMRTAHRIIADAAAIAESLARRHGRRSKCSVIPYGCEIVSTAPSMALLAEWGLAPQSYYLVVCRLEPENHVLEILEAFQQSHSGKELIVVGNHESGTSYVETLRSVEDRRIRMVGTIYDQAKLTALRFHSFAYLHGHSVGGTNPSLLEAMGCGNLIMAHDNAFNRETLASCGLYFKTALDLTVVMQDAEGAENRLAQLRESARQRAATSYHWPDIVHKYLELLRETSRIHRARGESPESSS